LVETGSTQVEGGCSEIDLAQVTAIGLHEGVDLVCDSPL